MMRLGIAVATCLRNRGGRPLSDLESVQRHAGVTINPIALPTGLDALGIRSDYFIDTGKLLMPGAGLVGEIDEDVVKVRWWTLDRDMYGMAFQGSRSSCCKVNIAGCDDGMGYEAGRFELPQ